MFYLPQVLFSRAFALVQHVGMFESYVTTGSDGKELLYIGAGALGIYVDIETLKVVEKVSRNISSIEEVPTKPRIRLVEKTYNPDDYED